MAYVALMVFVCALFLLVTAFRTSHNDLMVVGISWVDPTGTLQAVGNSPVCWSFFQVVEFGENGGKTPMPLLYSNR